MAANGLCLPFAALVEQDPPTCGLSVAWAVSFMCGEGKERRLSELIWLLGETHWRYSGRGRAGGHSGNDELADS